MTKSYDSLIVGAGIFGVTAALALKSRGYKVALLDPGPLPHPLAASTDINKAVRITYGADESYMALGEKAIEGWHAWNSEFNDSLYHEAGMIWLTEAPMQAGDYEYESFKLLKKRGHHPERLNQERIRQRFPAFNADKYVDGFFNPHEGYAESGRVVSTLIEKAKRDGISLYAGQDVAEVLIESGQVIGIRSHAGEIFDAESVVLAAGAWTPYLYSDLLPFFRITGQPIYHLKPSNPSLFDVPNFGVFGADIMKTGWYGFPLHPREQVVKIGYHSLAQTMHPTDDDRIVTDHQIADLQQFLSDSIPPLANAEIVYMRCCLYCNTLDEDFLIANVPQIQG